MADDGNVVFLKLKSPEQTDDTMAFLACRVCRNKTYTHTVDDVNGWTLCRCAACGNHIGRIGWAN